MSQYFKYLQLMLTYNKDPNPSQECDKEAYELRDQTVAFIEENYRIRPLCAYSLFLIFFIVSLMFIFKLTLPLILPMLIPVLQYFKIVKK